MKTSVKSWFEIFETRRFDGMDGHFVHAFMDRDVMAGNGTIAVEILEDLPEVAAVIAPFGGGGLACGIAAGLRALAPSIPVYASEVKGQAPFSESLRADSPVSIDYTPTFVDGIGSPYVEPAMWDLSSNLLAGSLEVTLSEVAAAVRLLVSSNGIVAEGAGASSVAAEQTGTRLSASFREGTWIRRSSQRSWREGCRDSFDNQPRPLIQSLMPMAPCRDASKHERCRDHREGHE